MDAGELFDAIERDDPDGVRRALDAGVPVESPRDGHLVTPLMAAAERGSLPVVALLLARGADVGARDAGGWTPLHYAARGGAAAVARALRDAGADPDARDGSGYSPLTVAIAAGPDAALALVERGSSARTTDAFGFTPLHAAAWFGRDEVVTALLAAGADPNARSTARHAAYGWKKGATAADVAGMAGRGELRARLEQAARRAGGAAPPSLDEVIAEVERACLGGEKAPEALRALWAAELAGASVLGEVDYGEVELARTMEDFFPEEFFAHDAGPAFDARLREVRFFAREADDHFLGLWKYRADVPLDQAPVVVLDSEGSFRLTAPTIQEHFARVALEADGGTTGRASRALAEMYAAFGVPAARPRAAVDEALRAFPSPDV